MAPDLVATIPIPTAKAGLLLSQSEAWEFVGLPRSTWFRLRSAGKLPNPVEVPSGGLYWLRSDLENWVANLKYIRRAR